MNINKKITEQLNNIKLIDFGSCIQLKNIVNTNIAITTPEYLPPELLEYSNKHITKNKFQTL